MDETFIVAVSRVVRKFDDKNAKTPSHAGLSIPAQYTGRGPSYDITGAANVWRLWNRLMARLLNAILYQFGWFACVLGASFARPGIGMSIAIILIGVHLYLTTERANQLKLMLLAACVGLIVDSTLLALGVYRFPGAPPLDGLPPPWMTLLWIQFATTFRYCLRWLSSRYLLCAVLGLVGAPLAFLGGEKLGAVEILPPEPINLAMLGGLWCIAIPLLIWASDRMHAGIEIAPGYRGLSPSS